jgi:hypothetical protein
MNKTKLDKITEELLPPFVPTDDIITTPILEVLVKDSWVVTDEDIWKAWTGLRRINGEEYHGDVNPIAAPTQTWTGPRVCGCKACQVHVEAKHRPN